MRLLLSFFGGLLLSFFLSDLLFRVSKGVSFLRILSFNYSVLGLVLILGGLSGAALLTRANSSLILICLLLAGSGIGLLFHHLLSERYILFEKLEKRFVREHENGFERLVEIIPGATLWLAITSPIWLSFTLPFAVAYTIILADIYWLISALKITVLIYIGYKRTRQAVSQGWSGRLKADFPKEWSSYYHLLVIPTYMESLEVLTPTFDAVVNSSYPQKKIFMAVGFEEREERRNPEKIQAVIAYLNKLAPKIGGVFTTIHPFGLPGEVPGPGSNRNFMIKNAVKKFKALKIKENQVLVTTLDADFVIHPQFLAGALYKYLSTDSSVRDRRTYTGVFFYYNNYWQAPTPMRLIAVGTAFWQLAEMVGSDKYRNFASMSINLKSLLKIGLWIPDKVNDDSGFYWKAYYHFKGDYKVIPHFLPIYGDTVLDVTLLKTLENQYQQQKRWAYGVEHMPYIVKEYFKGKDLNFWGKTDNLFFALWGYIRWGMLALFVAFAGLIIPLVNPHYTQSVVAYNLPVVSSWILTAAFLGILATIFVHEKTVPKRPAHWSILKKIWSYIQWVLIPLIMVTISTIPAIDALTTLMLGRYLEFRITRKVRLS